MSFITSLLSGTPIAYAAAGIAALVLMLGVIGGTWRRSKAPRSDQGKRLALVEVEKIDRKRTVILIRRDGVEHLVLLGGTRDLLIETHRIDANQRSAPPRDATPQGVPTGRRSNVPHRMLPVQAVVSRRIADR